MVRGKYFAPTTSPCFQALREPSWSTGFPDSGQKNPSFPFLTLTDPVHTSFLIDFHTQQLGRLLRQVFWTLHKHQT